MSISREPLKAGSFHFRELPEGCKQCLAGRKSVLFATSRCGVGCYYCTIPTKDKQEDLISINEVSIPNETDSVAKIFEEINTCGSTGVGITGGDPLARPYRALKYIKYLKTTYGSNFHIHLYTSAKYLTEELMLKLAKAGVDEVRIHPKHLEDTNAIIKAVRFKTLYPKVQIGFELPAIPNKQREIEMLLQFAEFNQLDFVILNEFEMTDSNFITLKTQGFQPFPDQAAISGSAEMVDHIFKKLGTRLTIPIHFCSSRSKDRVQLTNRYRRRANNVARPFESISEEGELEFAVIYARGVKQISQIVDIMVNQFEIPDELFELSNEQIETSWLIAEEILPELRKNIPDLKAEIQACYPIKDSPIIWSNPI